MSRNAKTGPANKAVSRTNFDVWKEALTPEFIASGKFIVLSCGACPASGKTCNKYDTACRGNFMAWAKGEFEEKEASVDELSSEDIGLRPKDGQEI